MAATRVQRFGCSQTTDLTTKQRAERGRSEESRAPRKVLDPGVGARSGQAAAQQPLESPESPFQSTPGLP